MDMGTLSMKMVPYMKESSKITNHMDKDSTRAIKYNF